MACTIGSGRQDPLTTFRLPSPLEVVQSRLFVDSSGPAPAYSLIPRGHSRPSESAVAMTFLTALAPEMYRNGVISYSPQSLVKKRNLLTGTLQRDMMIKWLFESRVRLFIVPSKLSRLKVE